MFYLCHNTFLCNQLFPFANVIAFALANGASVIYPTFRKHAEHFPFFRNRMCQFPANAEIPALLRVMSLSTFCERWFLRVNHKADWFPHVLMTPDQLYDFDQPCNRDSNRRMLSARVGLLDGLYLLSNAQFSGAKDVLRKVFSPSLTVQNNVRSCIRRARTDTDILIGTHLRFGDYLTLKPDVAYEREEYHAIMCTFSKMFPGRRVTFLLCSDKPQDADMFPAVRTEKSTGHYVEDLYCLSRCDLIIGPPSTFSQWASFYGQVPVYSINYKNELKYNLPVREPDLAQFHLHLSGFGRHSVSHPGIVKCREQFNSLGEWISL
jgi:hypothetical protein